MPSLIHCITEHCNIRLKILTTGILKDFNILTKTGPFTLINWHKFEQRLTISSYYSQSQSSGSTVVSESPNRNLHKYEWLELSKTTAWNTRFSHLACWRPCENNCLKYPIFAARMLTTVLSRSDSIFLVTQLWLDPTKSRLDSDWPRNNFRWVWFYSDSQVLSLDSWHDKYDLGTSLLLTYENLSM